MDDAIRENKTPPQQPVMIAAGGTGGHLFPAQALAEALFKRGCIVHLMTDARVDAWTESFPGSIHILPAGTVTKSGIVSKIKGLYHLARGYWAARKLMKRLNPAMVIGFGGYPSVAPLLAGKHLGIKTMIHEANAVMGRANRFLAPFVDRIATGFPLKNNLFPHKTVETGNPVRKPVIFAANLPIPPFSSKDPFHILVFGGSQGARVMSDVVPQAIEHLPKNLRHRLIVTQQTRDEDYVRVDEAYRKMEVVAEIRPFFRDLPNKIANSHLVIARAGASTIAEIALIGRACVLVPLPGSLDQDQHANAQVLEKTKAAYVFEQKDFTAPALAATIEKLMENPMFLRQMGLAAQSVGVANASDRLAGEVLGLAAPY